MVESRCAIEMEVRPCNWDVGEGWNVSNSGLKDLTYQVLKRLLDVLFGGGVQCPDPTTS